MRFKTVFNGSLRSFVPFKLLLKTLERGMPIALPRHKGIKDDALLVNGTPEVLGLNLHFHENLIEVPAPVVWTLMQLLLPLPGLLRDHRAKAAPPKPNSLVAYVDASFVEKILDLLKRQRISGVHHDCKLDNGW